MADAGSDIIFLGLTRDIVGNIGIAVMTIIASGIGFLLSSAITRSKDDEALRRQKLEAMCIGIQEAIFNITRLNASHPLSENTIRVSAENEAYAAGMHKIIGQIHAVKMLYFKDEFKDSYQKIIHAYRIIGVVPDDGGSAYSRSRLSDLLGALAAMNSVISGKFAA